MKNIKKHDFVSETIEEEKARELIEFVLHDFAREAIEEKIKKIKNEIKKEPYKKDLIQYQESNTFDDQLKIYEESCYKDAEKTEKALDIYIKVIFKENETYKKSDGYLIFNDNIKITADILTGHNKPRKKMEGKRIFKETKGIENAMSSFERVVYTIGNLCPTFVNYKPGSEWDDIIAKLNFLEGSASITEAQSHNNLRKRENINLFSIFELDENISNKKQIIQKLYFQDYYKDDSEPKLDNHTRNDLGQYLIEITKGIIQRGFRIACENYGINPYNDDKTFNDDATKIIFNIFEKVGLHHDNDSENEYKLF